MRNGLARSELVVTSKIRIRPLCSRMKRWLLSLLGAVMKTGELRLVLIDCSRRLVDCDDGGGEPGLDLDPSSEHPIKWPTQAKITLAISKGRICFISLPPGYTG